MITYAELTQAVARNIKIDYNATDLLRFQVVDNINAAIRSILTSMPMEFLTEPIKTVQRDLDILISAYQWPSDFIRLVKLWVKWSAGDDFIECRDVRDTQVDSVLSLDNRPSLAYPKIGLDAERGFYLKPAPTADVEDGHRIRYIYLIPDVSSDQQCLLDKKFKNLIVYGASADSCAVEGSKADLAPYWEAKRDKEQKQFLPKAENK